MIILTILKWIGIILLVLLGLILLVLAVVLFVPVRYRACGSFLSDIPDGTVTARWLFGTLRAGAEYHRPEKAGERPEGFSAYVKVLWLTLFEIPDKTPDVPAEETQISTEQTDSPPVTAQAEESSETPVQAADERPSVPDVRPAAGTEDSGQPPDEEDAGAASEEEQPGWFERTAARISGWWKDVSETGRALYQSIKKRTDGAAEIWKMLNDESNRKEMELLKRGIIRILKEFVPKGGSGRIRIGTGDPYSTGQIIQFLAMLYPVYGDTVEVIPEFTESVHDAEGDIRGAVRLFPIVWSVLRVVLNKRLRAIYKKCKQILDREILA